MNATKGIGGHTLPNNGRTNNWLTPPELLRKLGRFDLDPCCPVDMPWRTADWMISTPADGLAEFWSGRVWLNPPYGEETGNWLSKLADHRCGTALVFARTETRMFREHVWPWCSAVLFIDGRLHFHRTDGIRSKLNAGGPSVLIAYGESDAEILRASGIAGKFLEVNGAKS